MCLLFPKNIKVFSFEFGVLSFLVSEFLSFLKVNVLIFVFSVVGCARNSKKTNKRVLPAGVSEPNF